MSVKRAKRAPTLVKYTVFGYLRDRAKLYRINLPNLVQFLCLDYYQLVDKLTYWKAGTTGKTPNPGDRVSEQTLCGVLPITCASEGVLEYQWTFKATKDFQNAISFLLGIADLDGVSEFNAVPWILSYDCREDIADLVFNVSDQCLYLRYPEHSSIPRLRCLWVQEHTKKLQMNAGLEHKLIVLLDPTWASARMVDELGSIRIEMTHFGIKHQESPMGTST